MRTVVSGRYHYSVSYPVTWQTLHVAGGTFAATAADHNAAVSITTELGSAGILALRKAVLLAFTPFGHLLRPPIVGSIDLHGATGVLARGQVTTKHGNQSSVLAVTISRQGRLYTLLGVVLDAHAHTAQPDSRAVEDVIAGVRFF